MINRKQVNRCLKTAVLLAQLSSGTAREESSLEVSSTNACVNSRLDLRLKRALTETNLQKLTKSEEANGLSSEETSDAYTPRPSSYGGVSLIERAVKPLLIIGTSLLALSSNQEVKAANFTVVATGLDGPRGLTFGPDEVLYVAEAGRGGDSPCIPSPSIQGAVLCSEPTGAIAKLNDGTVERLVTGLPSVASLNSVIPDGSDASGPHDIQFDANGTPYVITDLASNPANRDTLLGISDFGQVLAIDDLNGTPAWTRLADLARYEQTNNTDGDLNPGGVNTNPFYLSIQGETAWATDAGGNDLLSVDLDTGERRRLLVKNWSILPLAAIAPDNSIYLSNQAFLRGEGEVIRVETSTPETTFLLGFFGVTVWGIASQLWFKC